ncbi:hypothetical protein NDN08_000240 [Rhodosorus marinus]|uniref:Ribosomal silencing factor RsfS n=1 Tax=Rhodosorus marinus TaxID=101924 RepID=A0AAV8UHD0_9RHOD|nr:hypothetical protein NDN08_000240 [Rhodosorus marinus]
MYGTISVRGIRTLRRAVRVSSSVKGRRRVQPTGKDGDGGVGRSSKGACLNKIEQEAVLKDDAAVQSSKEQSAAQIRSMSRLDEYMKRFPIGDSAEEFTSDSLRKEEKKEEARGEEWDEDLHGPMQVKVSEVNVENLKPRMLSEILEERRAMDVHVIDVREKCTFTEYFIVATGRTHTHQKNLAWEIRRMLAAGGRQSKIQGLETNWVVVDCGNIIVHIMSEDSRDFFDLDSLWKQETSRGMKQSGRDPGETLTGFE